MKPYMQGFEENVQLHDITLTKETYKQKLNNKLFKMLNLKKNSCKQNLIFNIQQNYLMFESF